MDAARELLIQINEVHSLYLQLSYDFWIQYSLYTWKWWLLVLIMILPWYFWWCIVDKKRLLEISFYGVMTFVAVSGTDAMGVAYAYWIYPIKLSPLFPHILPVDFTMLPIIYMLFYQFFTKWKSFIIASIVMAACLAFIGEPIIVWLGFYELITWKYHYGFPIYVLYAIVFKYVVQKVISTQKKVSSRDYNQQ